jgi:hypothetical protein
MAAIMSTEQINDYLQGNPATKIELDTLLKLAISKDKDLEAAALLLSYNLTMQSTLNFPLLLHSLTQKLHTASKDEQDMYTRALAHIRAMLLRKGQRFTEIDTRPNYALFTEYLREVFEIPKSTGTEVYMANGIYKDHPKILTLKEPILTIQKAFKSAFQHSIEKGVAGCVLMEHLTPTVCEICESVGTKTPSYVEVHKGRQPNGHLLLQTLYDSKSKQKEVLKSNAPHIARPLNAFVKKAGQLL